MRVENVLGPKHEAARIPARLALGASMAYHGTSKLRGEGPAHTAQFFENLGIRPARFWAVATGIAETFAGVATLFGLATRPAALAVLATQAVAISKVHAAKGFDIAKGGMEFNLAIMAIAAGLLLAGPGQFSTQAVVARRVAPRGARRIVRRSSSSRLARVVHLLA